MKKVLALLLTASLTLALTLSGWAAETGEQMRASSWAKAELERAWEHGVFPEELDPYRDDCTREMIRAEFAAVTVQLYELMGGRLHLSPSFQRLHPHPFTDIDNYDYDIREAYGLGFINGMDVDRFDPNGTLTREQAAAMLGRVYEKVYGSLPQAGETAFADNEKISVYAVSAVAFLARNGVVGGVGDNEFAPKRALTVQEAVIMTLRMLEVESWEVPETAKTPEPSPSPEETAAPETSPTPGESPDPETAADPEESPAPTTAADPEESPAPETTADPEEDPAPESTPEAGGEAAAESTETPAVGPVG